MLLILTNFGGHRLYGNRDIIRLVYNAISQDHVTKLS